MRAFVSFEHDAFKSEGSEILLGVSFLLEDFRPRISGVLALKNMQPSWDRIGSSMLSAEKARPYRECEWATHNTSGLASCTIRPISLLYHSH